MKKRHDNWITPKVAWKYLQPFIPSDKIIWEPFYCNGQSGIDLKELGFHVHHEPNEDFFKCNYGDIIISNPPFSQSTLEKTFKRLIDLDKPFVLLMPVGKLVNNYIRDIFKDVEPLQYIIPPERIVFSEYLDGEITKRRMNYPTIFYCYKMDLARTVNYIY